MDETFETIRLENGHARVEIIPALGGKISSLVLGGREWLWTSDVLPRVAPTEAVAADDDASYVRTADTGGFDECVPTVGYAKLPDGLVLPDHGELWSQHAPTERVGDTAAVTRWRGRRLPYTLARTVRVQPGGVVRMEYALTNDGAVSLPFLWSSHPLLPLTPDTRLDLPIAARVRVWAQHGLDLGGEGAEHRWPMVRVSNREVDFTHPGAIRGAWACKLFLDLPAAREGRTRIAIEQGDARLECAFATAEVPNVGVWLNHAGWTPFDGGVPYTNLAFEPCIGAGDTLGAWDGTPPLGAGETRRWTLEWRGLRRPS